MVSYIMMVNQNRWMLCLCFVKFLLECVVKSFSHFLSKCIFSRHFIRHQYFCAWLRLILIWINILTLYLSINVKGNWILRRELVYDKWYENFWIFLPHANFYRIQIWRMFTRCKLVRFLSNVNLKGFYGFCLTRIGKILPGANLKNVYTMWIWRIFTGQI